MTKTELIAELNAKFYIVRTPVEQSDIDNLKYYLVKVFNLVNDGLREMNLGFYVENEGDPSEAAFWSPSEPKPSPAPRFLDDIHTYIQAKIDDNTIEGGFLTNVNEANEVAFAFAIVDVAGTLTKKEVILDRDPSGDIRHRVV